MQNCYFCLLCDKAPRNVVYIVFNVGSLVLGPLKYLLPVVDIDPNLFLLAKNGENKAGS